MSRFQIEFRQVVHQIAPYHPVVMLLLLLGLAVVTVRFSGMWYRSAPQTISVTAELQAVERVRRSLDALDAYLESTMPLADIDAVFGRVEPEPVVPLPEVDTEVVEAPPPPEVVEPLKVPPMRLTAVYRASGRPLAEINGKLYGGGDVVEGVCRLRVIHQERVVLEVEDGRIITLVLYEGGTDAAP